MPDLKNCPMCGDKAELAAGYASCQSCSAWAQVEDWNRRAQPAGMVSVPAHAISAVVKGTIGCGEWKAGMRQLQKALERGEK